MSQEISKTTQYTYRKNGVVISRQLSTVADAAGNGQIQSVQSVGTVDETLAKGDITNIGFVYVKNLDATNFVQIGPDGTVYNVKLKPGEDSAINWQGTAVHAKSDTAACLVDYFLVEA